MQKPIFLIKEVIKLSNFSTAFFIVFSSLELHPDWEYELIVEEKEEYSILLITLVFYVR